MESRGGCHRVRVHCGSRPFLGVPGSSGAHEGVGGLSGGLAQQWPLDWGSEAQDVSLEPKCSLSRHAAAMACRRNHLRISRAPHARSGYHQGKGGVGARSLHPKGPRWGLT